MNDVYVTVNLCNQGIREFMSDILFFCICLMRDVFYFYYPPFSMIYELIK